MRWAVREALRWENDGLESNLCCMSKLHKSTLSVVGMALAALLAVSLALMNASDRRSFGALDEGVTWVDGGEVVVAWHVRPGSPAERAGIRAGDQLKALDGKEISSAVQATQKLYEASGSKKISYDLERNGESFQVSLIPRWETSAGLLQDYLLVVGFLFLAIGLFVVSRRRVASGATHFFLFCLSSFILFAFSHSGRFDTFDWTIYWLDAVAWVLQPALFLHFCLNFPSRVSFGRMGFPRAFVYVPGWILLVGHVLVAGGGLSLAGSQEASLRILDRVGTVYLAVFFLAGVLLLYLFSLRTTAPLVRQQLKWLSWGSAVALAPFTVLYAVPYVLGRAPVPGMEFAALSLGVMPLTFAYAVIRYRLMDVDLLFQRGFVYSLATGAMVALYFGLTTLTADLFGSAAQITSRAGWIIAIVITALLFRPVVNWIQQALDRTFYRDRFAYRKTLLDFARDLGSEVRLDPLLDALLDRLSQTLNIERAAIFLEDTVTRSFRLSRSVGFSVEKRLDLSFLSISIPELRKGHLFYGSFHDLPLEPLGRREVLETLGLHYYIPLTTRGRTSGYLGLDETRQGGLLSSEDVELVRTLAGYFSIAVENARLYESLEKKVQEYESLKEFNENILESGSTGVVAENLTGRVEYWNTAMEMLYGLPRAGVLGRPTAEIFPPELVADIRLSSDLGETRSLYKHKLLSHDGRRPTVNISLTPLRGKNGNLLGRLLLFNNITDRVRLEDQVAQAEKLSSIGMLAAGVAHEVNTPLAVISSQTQMLRKMVPSGDPKRVFLEKIIKQTFRASDIVNHLLKFSRTRGTEFEETDLNKVLGETLMLLDHVLDAGRIRVESRLSPELPPIHGNSGRMQQVFMNLILNARDAMPEGGRLLISTWQENSTVLVEVVDSGEGIANRDLGKIYDPFFTTKSGSRGTGLGLAVSYGIIREHSGTVQVKSEPGRGTTFRLEFPALRKPVHA